MPVMGVHQDGDAIPTLTYDLAFASPLFQFWSRAEGQVLLSG